MATLTSVLHPDHGFHPTATTTLQIPAEFDQCTVHLVYTLPPLVFVDKYELANHHESYSFDFWGTSNLEYPVFAVEQSDSILLVNVKQGAEVRVPLHLRYGKPGDGFDEARLSWPAGFLACPAFGESACSLVAMRLSYVAQSRARPPQTCQSRSQSSSRNQSLSFQ